MSHASFFKFYLTGWGMLVGDVGAFGHFIIGGKKG